MKTKKKTAAGLKQINRKRMSAKVPAVKPTGNLPCPKLENDVVKVAGSNCFINQKKRKSAQEIQTALKAEQLATKQSVEEMTKRNPRLSGVVHFIKDCENE